jgi:RNA polymerase sigma-54 factor
MPQLEQKLQAKLVQKLIITPQLQQAIRLLQLNKLDLQNEISQELLENPALEELGSTSEVSTDVLEQKDAPSAQDPTAAESGAAGMEDSEYAAFFRDLDDSYQPTHGTREFRAEDMPALDQLLRSEHHLADHLMWQLEMSAMSGVQRQIGEAIIGNLDERGYLEASIEELLALAPEQNEWSAELVEQTRALIMRFDPVGVASRTLQECLLVQLEVAELDDLPVATALRDHFPLLESKRHAELALAMSLEPADVEDIFEIIRHLDPRPGERYNPQPTSYITPDVYVIKDGEDYRIALNEEGLPRLRVSPTYRRFFDDGGVGRTADASTKEFVRDKVRAAFRLIRSLEERQRTIYKVANSIVKFQRSFLDHGIEQIRPLVLRDVAEDIGMHESTVSRVVNNKYMHTHRGLFEMRIFFHSGLASSGGDAVSSLTVKDRIKRMIEKEDSSQPLSDQAIAEILKKDGLQIARRTVAKYREELRIPSSTERKRPKH